MVPDVLDLGVDIIVLVSDVLNLGVDIDDLVADVLVLGVDRSPWAHVGGRSYRENDGGGVKREMVNHGGRPEAG